MIKDGEGEMTTMEEVGRWRQSEVPCARLGGGAVLGPQWGLPESSRPSVGEGGAVGRGCRSRPF